MFCLSDECVIMFWLTTPGINLTWLFIALTIFLLHILVFLYLRVDRQKKLLAEKENLLIQTMLDQTRADQKLREDEMARLTVELQLREQDLVYKSLIQAELLQINRSVRERLLPFLIKIPRKKDQDDFRLALTEITQDADRDPLTEFEITFKQLHHDFYDKLLLIAPSLTASEMKIAAMIRLNLSTRDIAHLGNISQSTVEAARFRIRKKLELEPKQNLTSFLIAVH